MKTKSRQLLVLACALVASLPKANAAVILSDNFNGQSVNISIWTPSAPLSDSQIGVSGGTANFFQRGILVTNNSLPNAIDITGRFAFTGGSYDQFQINLRTNGVLLSPYYNFQNNIYVGFNRRGGDDGNQTGLNNLTLAAGVNTPGVLGNFTFLDNVFYDFRVLDTGTSISVFIGDLNNPLLSVNTTERTGNLLGIENRGFVPFFPTYDNAVKLDFIQISTVPDFGSTIGLLTLALLAITALRKRRNLEAHTS